MCLLVLLVVVRCGEVEEELFCVVRVEQGFEVGLEVEFQGSEFFLLGSPASQAALLAKTDRVSACDWSTKPGAPTRGDPLRLDARARRLEE